MFLLSHTSDLNNRPIYIGRSGPLNFHFCTRKIDNLNYKALQDAVGNGY